MRLHLRNGIKSLDCCTVVELDINGVVLSMKIKSLELKTKRPLQQLTEVVLILDLLRYAFDAVSYKSQ